MTKSHFWPDCPIVITMYNFKAVAQTNLRVYNAEHLCVSFFYQVASIRHLGGGKIKKVFLGFLMGNTLFANTNVILSGVFAR